MAKFCGKCGSIIEGNEKFCTKCGNSTEQANTPAYSYDTNGYSGNKSAEMPINKKSERKKVSKFKIILITVILLLIAAVVLLTVGYFTSPSFEVYKCFNDGNYAQASLVYQSDVKGNFIFESIVALQLKESDIEIAEKYKNGEISYENAIEALKALEVMGFTDATDTISSLTKLQESNAALANGDKYYASGDYSKAVEEYSKIEKDSEYYDEAQSKLSEIYPKYVQSVSSTAKDYYESGEYEKAITLINTAVELVPNTEDITALLSLKDDCLVELMDSAVVLINSGEYIEALEIIDSAIAINDNEDLQKLKETAEEEYVKNITSKVQKCLDQEDYISASRTVANALTVLPNNTELKSLKSKVEKETPTYLLDVCKPYSYEYYTEYINGETFPMGGDDYTDGFTLNIGNHGFAIFNVDSTYSSLSFMVGHVDDTALKDTEIKIYCDGVLKKTVSMDSKALPKKITIDITGVDQVEISSSGDTWQSAYYGFGNVTIK